MFLQKTLEKNPNLIKTTIDFHINQKILPDTYVIDMDQLMYNAKKIIDEANMNNMEMYFMLKQVGRNPYIAKKLIDIGYKGTVVVDFREAQLMMSNNIPISNVGHLVQPPKALLQKLVDYNCEYFTAYSLDKIKDINECAKKSNKIQKLLIRVVDKNDMIYSGQTAGFNLDTLDDILNEIIKLANVKIAGITSFPCFLYDEQIKGIKGTNNLDTVLKAKKIIEGFGIKNINVNTPSTTCVETIGKMRKYGATSGEPGHGLTGTTPFHATHDTVEKPCVVYLSEISHNFQGKSYCYGGGFYRRSHVENALIGANLKQTKVIPPSLESIDYHFGLEDMYEVSESVIMAFRFQIFVTRSDVCLIEGISTNTPKIVGLYSSLGAKK